MGEQLLPPKWPTGCHEATKLPFCPDFRTYKSSSSNNSGETPKHPRHHRSFSGICQKNLSKFSKRIYICPEIFQKNLSKNCKEMIMKNLSKKYVKNLLKILLRILSENISKSLSRNTNCRILFYCFLNIHYLTFQIQCLLMFISEV